jgi:hypothetical protein
MGRRARGRWGRKSKEERENMCGRWGWMRRRRRKEEVGRRGWKNKNKNKNKNVYFPSPTIHTKLYITVTFYI